MTVPSGAASEVDVAVNLLWCVAGAVGGSEQYLVRQLHGLVDGGGDPGGDDRRFRPTLYVPDRFVGAHVALAARTSVATAPIDGSNRAARIVAENTWLARRTRRAALVHHGGGTVPTVGADGAVVLTVHDLQYLTYPGYFSPVKLRYLRATVPRSVARATVVAVPSEYVRATVVERFAVDPDRVVVVPHGLEPTLGVGATDPDTLRARYSLGGGPLLVLPAVTHPHKGHRFLLDVLSALIARSGFGDAQIVLLGGRGAAEDDVLRAVSELGLGDHVVRAGRVDDADRDGLLSMADVMVFPTEYEGFGAPVVEAMALGTPVVCSDHPAVLEVAGDAATVVSRDVDAWVDAIGAAIERPDGLVAAGRERAASFTSTASGAALARAYDAALGVERETAPARRRRRRVT